MSPAAPSVSRAQMLAYRVTAQGLHRDAESAGQLDVLDIGVQEAMGHPAALAFANRVSGEVGPDTVAVGPGHRLALTWSLRGAPHVHRRKDLDALAGALWPLSEADAAARLNETGPSVRKAGIAALEQYALAIDALHAVVRRNTVKGTVSTAMSRRLPPVMLRDCRPCKARHVSDSAMRVTALAAGVEIEPGTSPPVLVPRTKARPGHEVDTAALRRLAIAYASVLGPATVGDFAGYLEARRADVADCWPVDDLAEVSVDGRPAYVPGARLAALRSAKPRPIVRLLGPFDPYLQARDRQLIVPDKAVQKRLWPVLGRPGALLVDGEVAGVWRTKASGTRLAITVSSFADVSERAWRQVDVEAQVVARVRGASDVTVIRAS